jgi:hypothetical protein
MKNTKERKINYLANFVGYTEHAMGSTPPNIAVKWNFEWVMNATFNLQPLKFFDALTR